MSWEQHLDVTGGKVWFETVAEDDSYNLLGLVECTDDWVVWFQKIGCTADECPFPDTGVPSDFDILGGTVRLEPRKLLRGLEMSQPTSFLELCKGLLVPPPRQRLGYVFTASLRLNGWKPDALRLTEEHYLDGSLVQFAQFREPFNFVDYNSAWDLRAFIELGQFNVYSPRQFFVLILKTTYGWPLDDP